MCLFERRFAFLISSACLLQCAALAQSAALSAAPASGTIGGLTSFNLSLATASGAQPAALQWTMSYSPSDISSLSLTIAGTAASAAKTLSCAPGAGSTTCLIYGMNTTVIADGVIAQVSCGPFANDRRDLDHRSGHGCGSGHRHWRLDPRDGNG